MSTNQTKGKWATGNDAADGQVILTEFLCIKCFSLIMILEVYIFIVIAVSSELWSLKASPVIIIGMNYNASMFSFLCLIYAMMNSWRGHVEVRTLRTSFTKLPRPPPSSSSCTGRLWNFFWFQLKSLSGGQLTGAGGRTGSLWRCQVWQKVG